MTSNCISKYTALACNNRAFVEGDSRGIKGWLNDSNALILTLKIVQWVGVRSEEKHSCHHEGEDM